MRRFEINLTEDSVFSRLGSGLVASPDGRAIVYTTGQEGETQRLVLRPLDRFQETVLASGVSAAGTYNPFFSPDGEWLGFVTPRELKKISVTGGAPITLATVERSRGATWGKDGTIVFAPAVFSGLLRIPAAGGTAEPLTKLDEAKGEKTHRWPQWLPDGRSVLFTVRSDASADYEGASIELVRVDTGERKVVHRGGYYARYVPTGHVLYVQNGTLFALPFDAQRLEATGSQMPVLEGLETNPAEGSAQYGVSDNGLLTYLPRAEGLARSPSRPRTARDGRSRCGRRPASMAGPTCLPTAGASSCRSSVTGTGTSGCTTSTARSPPGSPSASATTPTRSGRRTAAGSPTSPRSTARTASSGRGRTARATRRWSSRPGR